VGVTVGVTQGGSVGLGVSVDVTLGVTDGVRLASYFVGMTGKPGGASVSSHATARGGSPG
jgi:hypothetical protein